MGFGVSLCLLWAKLDVFHLFGIVSVSVKLENHQSWLTSGFQLWSMDLSGGGVGKILTYCQSAEIHNTDASSSTNAVLQLHRLEKVGNHKVQMLSWCKLIVLHFSVSRLGWLSLAVSGKISSFAFV